jgi:hypothetical protein
VAERHNWSIKIGTVIRGILNDNAPTLVSIAASLAEPTTLYICYNEELWSLDAHPLRLGRCAQTAFIIACRSAGSTLRGVSLKEAAL